MNSGSPPSSAAPAHRRGSGLRENSSPRPASRRRRGAATGRRSVPSALRPSSQCRDRSCGKRWRSRVRPPTNSVMSSSVAEPRPVHPADLVVLAIGVVVAALAVADLVAGEDQRHALRQQQRGQLIAAQQPPPLEDRGIVGRPFDAAIEAVVVVGAVAVVFARWPRCACARS